MQTLKERGERFKTDKITYVLYSQSGFTEGVKRIAKQEGMLLFDLNCFGQEVD